jgi:hypothetical protein
MSRTSVVGSAFHKSSFTSGNGGARDGSRGDEQDFLSATAVSLRPGANRRISEPVSCDHDGARVDDQELHQLLDKDGISDGQRGPRSTPRCRERAESDMANGKFGATCISALRPPLPPWRPAHAPSATTFNAIVDFPEEICAAGNPPTRHHARVSSSVFTVGDGKQLSGAPLDSGRLTRSGSH